MHVVIAYRRSTQTVLLRRDFTDIEPAWAYRDAVTADHGNDRDVEVCLVGASSEAELRNGFPRYFPGG